MTALSLTDVPELVRTAFRDDMAIIVPCLVLAAFLGALAGWLLKHFRCAKEHRVYEGLATDLEAARQLKGSLERELGGLRLRFDSLCREHHSAVEGSTALEGTLKTRDAEVAELRVKLTELQQELAGAR